MRRPRDVGEVEAGPVYAREHASEPWEKRVRAMLQLRRRPNPPIMTLDELRRGLEDLGAHDGTHLSYHECWTASIANILGTYAPLVMLLRRLSGILHHTCASPAI